MLILYKEEVCLCSGLIPVSVFRQPGLNFFHHPARISCSNDIIGYVFCHDAACSYGGVIPYMNSRTDNAAAADPDIISDGNCLLSGEFSYFLKNVKYSINTAPVYNMK